MSAPIPAQRRPQVALDVVGERLQRRDVDEPDPGAELAARASSLSIPQRKPARVLPEPVGAQISALAPLGDRLPAARLGRRRPLEGGLEPAPHRRAERRQRVGFRTRFRLGGQPTDLTQRPRGRAVDAGIRRVDDGRPVKECRRRTSRRRPGGLRRRSLGRRGRSRRRSCRRRAGRRPRTSRPAGAATSPGWLSSRRKAPLSWCAWPLGPLAKMLAVAARAAGAPAELGDPEALAGVVVAPSARRGLLRSCRSSVLVVVGVGVQGDAVELALDPGVVLYSCSRKSVAK